MLSNTLRPSYYTQLRKVIAHLKGTHSFIILNGDNRRVIIKAELASIEKKAVVQD